MYLCLCGVRVRVCVCVCACVFLIIVNTQPTAYLSIGQLKQGKLVDIQRHCKQAVISCRQPAVYLPNPHWEEKWPKVLPVQPTSAGVWKLQDACYKIARRHQHGWAVAADFNFDPFHPTGPFLAPKLIISIDQSMCLLYFNMLF